MNNTNKATIFNTAETAVRDLSDELDALRTTYKIGLIQWKFNLGFINRQYTKTIGVAGASVTSVNSNQLAISAGNLSPFGAAAAFHTRFTYFQRGTQIEAQFDATFAQDNFLGFQKMGFIRVEETLWFGTYFQGDICIGIETGGGVPVYLITILTPSTSIHTATLSIPSITGVNNVLSINMISSTGAANPITHTASQIATAVRAAQFPATFIDYTSGVLSLYFVYAVPVFGSVSITSPSITLSSVQTAPGVLSTLQLFPRSVWNRNSQMKLLLDYTQPQTYRIVISNFPYGNIDFSIYNSRLSQFEVVHTITVPSFGRNLMFPLVANVQSNPDPTTNPLGTPSNLTMYTTGGILYQQMEPVPSENRVAVGQSLSVASNIETPIISCRCFPIFNNRMSLGRLNLDFMTLAVNSTQRIRFNCYKGNIDPTVTFPIGTGTVTNYPDWKRVSNSILCSDTLCTTINLTDLYLVFQISLANTGTQILNMQPHNFSITDTEVFIITAFGPSTPDVTVALSFLEVY